MGKRTQKFINRESINIVISLLSLFSIVLISLDLFTSLDHETKLILEYGDFVICCVLLFDWLWRFIYIKKDRFSFLNFIDLLASLPTIEIARYGRLLRILRLFRVYKAHKGLMHLFQKGNRKESTLVFSISLLLILQIVSAALILQLEKDEGNIKNSADAIWWSFVTMTTVGYGDFYPVTTVGRILAAILMSAGIGFFSIVTGLISSWMSAENN